MSQPPDRTQPGEDARLTLSYDGTDYQGEMPAPELSAVLASLTDLAQGLSAADALGGGNRPRVRVQAFREGSFDIAAIVEAIGPGGYVVSGAGFLGAGFTFWWKNMRRVVVDAKHDADRGMWLVTMRSGEILDWTEEEWRIYNNKRIKQAVKGIAAPLRNGASLTLETPAETVTVPASDAHLFETEEEDEPAPEERRFETWVFPDTVSFNPDTKWRLWSRDTGSFAATIEDTRFADDVHLGRVRIGRNDSFKVALRSVTARVEHEKPRPRWFVERVIEHHPGAEQRELTDDAD